MAVISIIRMRFELSIVVISVIRMKFEVSITVISVIRMRFELPLLVINLFHTRFVLSMVVINTNVCKIGHFSDINPIFKLILFELKSSFNIKFLIPELYA